jgi:hypothetical protein
MEAPLKKKCRRLIARFTPSWQRAAAFLLRLAGLEVAEIGITPVFAERPTVQPLTQAKPGGFHRR